jgi:hypothetical protein
MRLFDLVMAGSRERLSSALLPLAAADPASLDRLHDIVEPSPASWWPLAPGWFVVAGVCFAGLLYYAVRAWRHWQQNAYRRAALVELKSLREAARTSPDVLAELPALLKRTAMVAYGRPAVASLYGDAWLAFLDESGRTNEFSAGVGMQLEGLAFVPGAPARLSASTASELLALAAKWITKHRTESRDVPAQTVRPC